MGQVSTDVFVHRTFKELDGSPTHTLFLSLTYFRSALALCDSRAHREWFFNRDQRSPEATLWYHYCPRKVERLRATGFVFVLGCGDHAVFRGNVARNPKEKKGQQPLNGLRFLTKSVPCGGGVSPRRASAARSRGVGHGSI